MQSRDGWFSTDAQAACCFSCSASKRAPFFQTIKVMAAILRASVKVWCEIGVVSGATRAEARRGSDRSKESDAATSLRCASGLRSAILSRIADQYLRDTGLEQGVQPRRAGTFFEGHMQTATQTADKLENRFRFRFEDRLHDQLPFRIPYGHGDGCLVNIQPNILDVIH